MPYPRANKDNQIPTACPVSPTRRHNIDRCIQYAWVQMLLQMDLYYTWVQLLHLCLPQVPLTRNPDPWCEFDLRRNQTFSLPCWHFQGSHISPYFLPSLRPRYVSFLPVCKCAGQNYVTWHALHDGSETCNGCLWQFDSCFRFVVGASEIVTVVSSNSSFISFWRSFRGNFWEVLWTLKLTQSQVGIVGLKIVNSLNRCIKFRKRNRLLVTFVVFFYRFVDFLTLNTLTQLYFKKSIHISDQYCFEKLPNN